VIARPGRKGLAILSNHRDYSQVVKHVNSICRSLVALTSLLDRTSSEQRDFLTGLANIARIHIVA
jgi:hypothetical protein